MKSVAVWSPDRPVEPLSLCRDMSDWPSWVVASSEANPTALYLLVVNAIIGCVWNVVKLIELMHPLFEMMQGFRNLSVSIEVPEQQQEVHETPQEATYIDRPSFKSVIQATSALENTYLITPSKDYHKCHLFRDCFQAKGRPLKSRPICRDCIDTLIKKLK